MKVLCFSHYGRCIFWGRYHHPCFIDEWLILGEVKPKIARQRLDFNRCLLLGPGQISGILYPLQLFFWHIYIVCVGGAVVPFFVPIKILKPKIGTVYFSYCEKLEYLKRSVIFFPCYYVRVILFKNLYFI